VSARLPDPLPHQFPFRLVERSEVIDGEHVAIVLGTAGGAALPDTEWPVTLVAEALAQAILLVVPYRAGGEIRLVGLDEVRLLQPVRPGTRLEVEVEERAVFGTLRRYSCRARTGGALAASAEITVSG
jgi:hypothetical protein